ncbi:MAG: transposase [Okeania sp. SIO2H7]|nr:transposase [Okeania sp. SIO2H7]
MTSCCLLQLQLKIKTQSMQNILPLLECLEPHIGATRVRQLSRITQAMLAMTGRATMLGISRWTGLGGSYRTILGWPVFDKLFKIFYS